MANRKGITEITAPVAAGNADTPLAVHFANESQGGLKHFNTITERDEYTKKFRVRCYKALAYVKTGENNYPSLYNWTGTQPDGSDGAWEFISYTGGFILADDQGGIPKLISSLVTTSSFSIQAAGDQGGAAILDLSQDTLDKLAAKGDGLISFGTYEQPQTFGKGNTLEFEPPFNVFPDPDKDKAFRVAIQHGYYEAHHAEGYLAYFDNEEVIMGDNAHPTNHKGTIWADKVAWGKNNVYMYEDRNDKAVILQETDTLDPNITGGTPIVCGLHLGFVGKAFEDGSIKAYLYDRNTNKPMLNSDGQPIGVIHNYKQGQDLEPITVVDIYMAKGATKAAWIVSHTFNTDPIKLKDVVEGDSCMLFQALDGKEEISPALNQFQILTGRKIDFERKYYGIDFFSIKWALSFDIPEQTAGANSGEISNLGLAMLNPDPLKASISSGVLRLQDDGTHMGYFMLGNIFSTDDTKNLRGKTIKAQSIIEDTKDATRIYMIKYVGDISKADMYFLKGNLNMQPTLASGWTIVDNAFQAEDYDGTFKTLSKDFIVPSDADLIAFMVGPQDEQSPMDISIKDFNVSVKNPFTTFDISGVSYIGQHPLKWSNTVAQFHTNNLRWTINKNKTNLPFGQRKEGDAPINLKSSEDDAVIYKGGLVLDADGLVSITVYVNLYLGEAGSKTGATVNFWVEDPDGNKIIGSDAPTTNLKAGDHTAHHFNWKFDYDGVIGDVLTLYAESNIDDGAYVENATYDAVGTLVNFKNL